MELDDSDDLFVDEHAPAPAKSTAAAAAGKKRKAPAGKENKADADDPFKVFESIDGAAGGDKRLSVERIYQKKTQLEHILLRPDTYIGSVEPIERQPMWVYDTDEDRMVLRDITYVPGLYKIFDEIIVNAADNKQRDGGMNTIKVNIDRERNEISVWNNGKGIPVVHHKVEQMYVPELIFGTLLTSSNYDDSERKVTGGRNGFGAKLCNIFSNEFTVETSCREYKKCFKQTWRENMQKTDKAKIGDNRGDDFTRITFRPDLAKFGMTELDDDIVALMSRRAYDIAGSSRGVKVFLNSKKLPVTGFKAYVEQYLKERTDDNGEPLKVVYEQVNDRWEVALTVSVDKGFQQVSFVNSIATTKGGRHVDFVADQVTKQLIEHVKKKLGKSGINIKPFQVKNHLWLFVNALIENPTFDSQTKETMTLQSKSFGSKCDLSDKFFQQTIKCGLVESVMAWVKFKQQTQLDQKCSGKKQSKLKGVPKLEDANDAGTKNSSQCTLILTEGDSAKTLAVSGLGVVGRDRYGVFPLKGKCLNVREATHKQIMENAEINNLIKIVGLQYKKKYNTDEDMKTLRYGKIMVMADQDQDGSHIKGLVINFVHHNWPDLIKHNFVEEFITPIVKATKGKVEVPFFSVPEYNEWKMATPNWHTWRIKYYKGLGTSTAKEAKEYFSDMVRHRIRFRYGGQDDDSAIELAFSKKKIEDRKEWLTAWMQERKTRKEAGQADEYLYTSETRHVTFRDFVNKELVLFSNMDNERSIPSLVDGLKPGQRKVLFTCLKRNDKREVKVAQLAGSVAEMSAYHHGEASLMSTIVGLAQNFVGSNNINLLLPIGQFGTRLQGGKDSASPRYIFTMLSPVARTLFCADDDAVLRALHEDNQRIEPEWYCPLIPMVLVNGAEGIGTGWSTKVPNYDPRSIVANIRRLIDQQEPQTMMPWYKGFKGQIEQLDATRFLSSGEVRVHADEVTVEITELPVRIWTQTYKESVLEPMLGTDKTPALIQDFKEYHTDTTVKFVVKLLPGKYEEVDREGFHKVFKLQSLINTSSMVLFDAEGCLRRFENVEDILKDFFFVRQKTYIARKKYMEGLLTAQSRRLSNQARFILAKISGEIVMENKKKKHIVEKLIELKFDPDPVKIWKEELRRKEVEQGGEVSADELAEAPAEGEGDEAAAVDESAVDARLSDFDYLVTMTLIKLSEEEKDKLLRESETKLAELRTLESKAWSDLWTEDLDRFVEALGKQEEKDAQDEASGAKGAGGGGGKKGAAKGGKRGLHTLAEALPSPNARRIQPKVDAALKQRMEKADQAKRGGGGGGRGTKSKKGAKDSDDELDNSSLVDRAMKDSPVLKKKVEQLSGGKQQPMTKFLDTKKKEAKPAAGKAQKGSAKAKKQPWDDEDSDSDEVSDVVISDADDSDEVATTSRPAAKRRQNVLSDDDYHEDGDSRQSASSPPPAKRASPPPPPKKTAAVYALSDDDDDAPKAASASPPPAKKPTKAKAAPRAKAAVDKPKKAPVKRPRKPAAAAARTTASSDDDDDAASRAPKKPTQKKAKAVLSDSDGADDGAATAAQKPSKPSGSRPARARKAVTYNYDQGGSDDNDDDAPNDDGDDSEFNASDA